MWATGVERRRRATCGHLNRCVCDRSSSPRAPPATPALGSLPILPLLTIPALSCSAWARRCIHAPKSLLGPCFLCLRGAYKQTRSTYERRSHGVHVGPSAECRESSRRRSAVGLASPHFIHPTIIKAWMSLHAPLTHHGNTGTSAVDFPVSFLAIDCPLYPQPRTQDESYHITPRGFFAPDQTHTQTLLQYTRERG